MLASPSPRPTLHLVDSSHTPDPSPEPVLVEIDSIQLLRGQRELRIRHGNEFYRLRHTRNDKLILTK